MRAGSSYTYTHGRTHVPAVAPMLAAPAPPSIAPPPSMLAPPPPWPRNMRLEGMVGGAATPRWPAGSACNASVLALNGSSEQSTP
jgi:hypothetical protein